MKEKIEKVINKYQGNGYLEIHIEEREFTSIEYLGKELETLVRSNGFLGNIRLYEKGYWYFASFMDNDIDKQYNKVMEMAKAGEGRDGGLTKAIKINDKIKTKYQIDPLTVPIDEKHNLVAKYNNIILNSASIQTSRVIYKDIYKKILFANNEKSFIEQDKIFTGISCVAVARNGMNVQTTSYSDAGYKGFEVVQNKEEEIETIIKDVNEMLNADQITGGRYNVILDNQMTGVFAHEAFGHLSEADFIYENPDMQEMMKLGRIFGKEIVNIIDDGTLEGLAGYTPYDDEGVSGQRTELIKKGKLNSRLNSRETAFKLGEKTTGNARALSPFFPPQVRMTNTFIDAGENRINELFEKCENGIYAKSYIGGMTNLEQFTFSPKTAYIIKNGKITTPVRDAVLSGNVFETIKNIEMVGNDLKHFGSLGGCGKGGQSGLSVTTGGPHILIKDVLVGGK